MWTLRVARDWQWQWVPWVQPAVRAAQGKAGQSVTILASVLLVYAGVALVMGRWTTEMVRRLLMMGLVGRALVTGHPWLGMWLRREKVVDSACCRRVTGHCRSCRRLPG